MVAQSGAGTVSTKQARIAELARQMPGKAMCSLSHHMDQAWLHEAFRQTRKDGAVGVDGQSAAEYAADLGNNLRALEPRAKSGEYRAPPVRRAHIPKGDGSETRPIGVPTFEDKVLQRAVVMLLEPVYEQDFYDFSYGFRPGRSAHDALEALDRGLHELRGGWVLDVDIRSFLDRSSHYTSVCWSVVEEPRKCVRDLDSQAFAASASDVDGFELAALYTLQHRLARHA